MVADAMAQRNPAGSVCTGVGDLSHPFDIRHVGDNAFGALHDHHAAPP
jgi:hypothetical protein